MNVHDAIQYLDPIERIITGIITIASALAAILPKTGKVVKIISLVGVDAVKVFKFIDYLALNISHAKSKPIKASENFDPSTAVKPTSGTP